MLITKTTKEGEQNDRYVNQTQPYCTLLDGLF